MNPDATEALKIVLKAGSLAHAEPMPASFLPHGHALAVPGRMDKLGLPKRKTYVGVFLAHKG